jgi:hypothetical protein
MRMSYVILVLALVAAGCSSSAALKPDAGTGQSGQGGAAGGAGPGGGGGATGTAGATTGAGGGTAGAGGAMAGAGGGTAGASGGLGYCDKDEDCVFHSVCCGGTCNAKTDPAGPPMVCSTSCAISLGPSTCGCVNHQCSTASACIVQGSGLCPYCPNGYLKGATGCETCQCAGGDGGADARDASGDGGPHALGEPCDDGLGCTSGLVCKAIGDPCPTYPKCNRCYRPCGDGGACPFAQRCVPPVGQGGDVCI